MLSKCSNPACSTPLIYLREGKIFMVESESGPQVVAPGPLPAQAKKKTKRVEHFWLCGPCSAYLTLSFDREEGVRVLPKAKPLKVVPAAAS